MKIFAAFLTIMTVGSFAQAGMIAVKEEEVPNYTLVLSRAISAATWLSCVDQNGETRYRARSDISASVRSGGHVWVDDSGTQPAIIVVTGGVIPSLTSATSDTTRIVTSPDYTEVISVETAYARLEKVNKGNLIAPKVVNAFVTYYTTKCERK